MDGENLDMLCAHKQWMVIMPRVSVREYVSQEFMGKMEGKWAVSILPIDFAATGKDPPLTRQFNHDKHKLSKSCK